MYKIKNPFSVGSVFKDANGGDVTIKKVNASIDSDGNLVIKNLIVTNSVFRKNIAITITVEELIDGLASSKVPEEVGIDIDATNIRRTSGGARFDWANSQGSRFTRTVGTCRKEFVIEDVCLEGTEKTLLVRCLETNSVTVETLASIAKNIVKQ